jgi:hypothetical protein
VATLSSSSTSTEQAPPHILRGVPNVWLLLPIVVLAMLEGVYFILRYGTNWLEQDTSTITGTANLVMDSGQLVVRGAYPNGYAYQTVIVWLSTLSGLPIETLQTEIVPALGGGLVAIVGTVFFRHFLDSWRLGTMATLFVLLQPDFLFITFRGSHEKITWPLVMAVLILLHKSTKSVGMPGLFMSHVLLMYLVLYALIATNSFFATVLITSLLVSVLFGAVVLWFSGNWYRRENATTTTLRRLLYSSVTGYVLVFTFIFHVYPPSQHYFGVLRTVRERVSAMFVSFETEAQPYTYISLSWTSSTTYLVLTVFTWLLLGGSFIYWLIRAYRLLRGRQLRLPEDLPWLLYAGYAFQLVLSVVVDFAGVLGSNVQLRMLPALILVASVLFVRGVSELSQSLGRFSRTQMVFHGVLGILCAWFAIASVMKATNDPVVSNKWVFISPQRRSP